MLRAQPVEHTLRGMVLLAMNISIPVEPRIDDLGEAVQFWAFDRSRPPVAGGAENATALSTVSREMLKWRAAARLLMPSAQARRTFR